MSSLSEVEISQFVSGFMDGDAISNYALELQKIIRGWGARSEIYGVGRHIGTVFPGRCIDVANYKSRPGNAAVFHFSVGSEMTDYFKNLPDKKVLIYHNITPAKYFYSIAEEKVSVLNEGRKQLLELSSVPDLSLAVSEYNAHELAEAGFRNPKVFPLLLTTQSLNVRPWRPTLKRYKKKGINVIFVGRVAPNKKIDDVIMSFYYVKKLMDPYAKLFIVGSYAGADLYLAYLRALIIELDLQDVFFTNHITQRDLISYYKLADIFLCMSEHEGSCIPLLEAMYFDVPVIALAAAGVPGTLGYAGVQVKERDYAAIAEMVMEIYTNQNLREAIIQKQRKRLADFDPKKLALQFRNVMAPVLPDGLRS